MDSILKCKYKKKSTHGKINFRLPLVSLFYPPQKHPFPPLQILFPVLFSAILYTFFVSIFSSTFALRRIFHSLANIFFVLSPIYGFFSYLCFINRDDGFVRKLHLFNILYEFFTRHPHASPPIPSPP